jgi:hypothetical protein
MPSKLSAWCNGIIEAGWIAALVIAPLYFNGYTSTVIEPDKLALLRAFRFSARIIARADSPR